jgi:hypothetical protein
MTLAVYLNHYRTRLFHIIILFVVSTEREQHWPRPLKSSEGFILSVNLSTQRIQNNYQS